MPSDGRSGAAGADPEQLWLRTTEPRRGRKPSFSREAVTAAAVTLADAEGLDSVTMRRVAAQVGAGVMSLYSYAPDKETLLELMVDHVSGELTVTDPPSGDWRTDLKTIAHLQRAHMLRHPGCPPPCPPVEFRAPTLWPFWSMLSPPCGPPGWTVQQSWRSSPNSPHSWPDTSLTRSRRPQRHNRRTGSQPKPATSPLSPPTAVTRNSPKRCPPPDARSPPKPPSPGSWAA